jgi:hypothetical protein
VNAIRCLNQYEIYLQEFRADPNDKTIKSVRVLLKKKVWRTTDQTENARICMKFSQFNDSAEVKLYTDPFFCINSKKILKVFNMDNGLKTIDKIFCVFIFYVPVHLILNYENDQKKIWSCNMSDEWKKLKNANDVLNAENAIEMNLTSKINTIGKQFARFSTLGANEVVQFLNHIWGRPIFTRQFVQDKFSMLISKRNRVL